MMGKPDAESGDGERFRGTLQIPQMIRRYGMQAAFGVNNVSNAFTPHSSCDPLSVTSLGIGIYQAGTKADTEVLLVSHTRFTLHASGRSLTSYITAMRIY